MIIGIDIDDTITKTSINAAKYLKEYAPEYTDYHDLPEDRYNEFLRNNIESAFTTNPLQEGVKKAFKYLRENNYKIIIITARNNTFSPLVEKITINYLKENNLFYDKIYFDKDLKGMTAKENGVKIFIDDKETVLDDISNYGIECIRITNDLDSKHLSFNNWDDIINYLKSRKE